MKNDHFWLIFGAVFIDNLCLYLYFSQKSNFKTIFKDFFDIVAILPLQYCKSVMASACTLDGRILKKPKQVHHQVGKLKK